MRTQPLSALLLAACTFAAEGTAADTDTDSEGETLPTLSPTSSTAASASSTSSAATSTDDATSSSSTSSATTAIETDDASSSSSSSASTSSSTSSSTDTGQIPGPYWDCWPDVAGDGPVGECPDDQSYGCLRSTDPEVPEENWPSACAPDCAAGCPGATGICLQDLNPSFGTYCLLGCEDDDDCPGDMNCEVILDEGNALEDSEGVPIRACLWP